MADQMAVRVLTPVAAHRTTRHSAVPKDKTTVVMMDAEATAATGKGWL